MVELILGILLFLVGMELLIEFFSAIFGTTLFFGIVIILIIKGAIKK